jgi:uncharacterized protein
VVEYYNSISLIIIKYTMEIIGFVASVCIGISLGLIGGGGSILTVPVLVYLFAVDAVAATAHSLFIVGITSIVGSVSYLTKGLVHIKTAVIFGTPSVVAVFVTRSSILPAIPQEVASIGGSVVTKSMLMMVLFAVLMIGASYNMIKIGKKKAEDNDDTHVLSYSALVLKGVMVGVVTGLVGAGGGFLIIPALVVFAKLPMKEAVGTSLVIIATNSIIGFLGSGSEIMINWILLSKISMLAIGGVFIGTTLSKKIDGAKLKPAFGWFILVTGVYIIFKETLLK